MPPPWSTCARTRSPSTPSTVSTRRPSSKRMRSPTRTSRGEALVLDGDDPLVGRRVALDERRRRTPVGSSNLRGKRPGADLRAAEVLQHRDGLPLRARWPARRRARRAPGPACVPCEKLRRATSMPASMRLRRPSSESHAGRACKRASRDAVRTWTSPRIVALAPLAPSTLEKALPIDVCLELRATRPARFGSPALGGARLAEVAAGTGPPRTSTISTPWPRRPARSGRPSRGSRTSSRTRSRRTRPGAVVRTFAAEGCGADVVSGAELRVALACGIAPGAHRLQRRRQDRRRDRPRDRLGPARASARVLIESVEEIARVEARARGARRGARASAIRINPSLDLAGATHAHIATGHDRAKFGVPRDDAARAAELVEASPHLELVGMTAHVGSHFKSDRAVRRVGARRLRARAVAARKRARAVARVRRHGRRFRRRLHGRPRRSLPAPAEFVRAARAAQRERGLDDLALYVEPGRCLVAPHGVLLARVIQTKVTATGALAHDRRRDERSPSSGALPGAPPHRPAARASERPGARRSPGASSVRSARAATTSASTCCRASRRSTSRSSTPAPTGSRWRACTTAASSRSKRSCATGGSSAGPSGRASKRGSARSLAGS